jgi:hypothetical protein
MKALHDFRTKVGLLEIMPRFNVVSVLSWHKHGRFATNSGLLTGRNTHLASEERTACELRTGPLDQVQVAQVNKYPECLPGNKDRVASVD